MAIRAAHYDQTVDTLTAQQVVIDLARSLPATAAEMASVVENLGGKSGFMNTALREYNARTADMSEMRPEHMHIGAVVEAIARIRPELAEVIVP